MLQFLLFTGGQLSSRESRRQLSELSVNECDSQTSCIMLEVFSGGERSYSVASADQCKVMTPLLDSSLYATLDGNSATFYCGGYLEETEGLVVTDAGMATTGAFAVYAASVVDACAGQIAEVEESGIDVSATDRTAAFFSCITSCPFVTAAPVAPEPSPEPSPSTQSTTENTLPSRFSNARPTKLVGYAAPMHNNFGGVRGALDELAVGIPFAFKYKLCDDMYNEDDDLADCSDSGTFPTGGCLSFTMLPVSPAATAMLILFPLQATSTVRSSASWAMMGLFGSDWFMKSIKSGAKLYLFGTMRTTTPAAKAQATLLISKVDAQKASDFATLGKSFASGSLGDWAFGSLVNSAMTGVSVNSAALNFAVHPFQEAFAYVFFSPDFQEETTEIYNGTPGPLTSFYAFALNMLVRRYSTVEEGLCGAGACLAKSTIYPPKYVDALGQCSNKRPSFGNDMIAMKNGFGNFAPSQSGEFTRDGCKLGFAPPAKKLGILANDFVAESDRLHLIEQEIIPGAYGAEDLLGEVEGDMLSQMQAKECDGVYLYGRRLSQSVSISGTTSDEAEREWKSNDAVGNAQACMDLVLINDQFYNPDATEGDHWGRENDDPNAAMDAEAADNEVVPWSYPDGCRGRVVPSSSLISQADMEQCRTYLINQGNPGWPEYEPCCDMNCDGELAINDLVLFPEYYGKTLPGCESYPPPWGRRLSLSTVDDVALPSLHPGTSSTALTADASPFRGAQQTRRLQTTGGASLLAFVKRYEECVFALAEEVDCGSLLSDLVAILPSNADPYVSAFYKDCSGTLRYLLNKAICDLVGAPVLPGNLLPPECPSDLTEKEIILLGSNMVAEKTFGGAKTSLYVDKGLPAATRFDTIMNAGLEFMQRML